MSFRMQVVIPPLGEVRLRHFTARNCRRGGGGAIDFIAYSPQGILWNDDLNKNQVGAAGRGGSGGIRWSRVRLRRLSVGQSFGM